MFSRMLKLPDRCAAATTSLLEIAIRRCTCPVPVKEQMISGGRSSRILRCHRRAWTACDSAEWLAHRGTVGRVLLGELHVVGEDMQRVPVGTPGTLWFTTASPFEYFKDPVKTSEARSPDGTMSTVGDVGYVDDEGTSI
jgi:long-chain acyl-CoA synthetase